MGANPDSMRTRTERSRGIRETAGGLIGRFAFLDPVIVLVLCLLAYGNALHYGFVSDDRVLITSRLPGYLQNFPFPGAFTRGFWRSTARAPASAPEAAPDAAGLGSEGEARLDYYRPLVILSYALDARIGRGKALGFHLTNLLLHALASILVWLMLLRLLRRRWIALAAALLFALHPIHVASVAWVSGRTDVLATVFLLLSWLAWDRYLEEIPAVRARPGPARSGRRIRLLLCLFFFALALLSKEIAGSMILVFALYAWMRRGGPASPRSGPSRVPWGGIALLAAVTLAGFALRSRVLGIPVLGLAEAPAFRPGVPFATYAWYLHMMCLPGTLHLFVPLHLPAGWTDPRLYASILLLAALLASTILLWRRVPVAGFGLAWFTGTVLPMSHLVPLGLKTVVAEYWAYLPSVGWTVFLAGLAGCVAVRKAPSAGEGSRITSVARRWAAPVVLLALALVGGGRIPARADPLRSEKVMLEHTTEVNPAHVNSWISLAAVYSREGRSFDATQCLLHARRLEPGARGLRWVLGNVYRSRGMPDSALVAYREELALFPDEDEVRINLANGLVEKGDEAAAAGLYRQAIGRSPRYAAVVRSKALDLGEQAQNVSTPAGWSGAGRVLRVAAGMLWALRGAGVDLDPGERQELLNLELLLARPGRIREAARLAEDGDQDGGGPASTAARQVAALLEQGDQAVPEAAALWTQDAVSAECARWIAGRWQETGRGAIARPVWRGLLRAHRVKADSLKGFGIVGID